MQSIYIHYEHYKSNYKALWICTKMGRIHRKKICYKMEEFMKMTLLSNNSTKQIIVSFAIMEEFRYTVICWYSLNVSRRCEKSQNDEYQTNCFDQKGQWVMRQLTQDVLACLCSVWQMLNSTITFSHINTWSAKFNGFQSSSISRYNYRLSSRLPILKDDHFLSVITFLDFSTCSLCGIRQGVVKTNTAQCSVSSALRL